MRSMSWLSAALFVSALGVVGFAAKDASAVPCCSAPICQREIPPPICASCSPGCFVDEVSQGEVIYDNDALLCYVAEQP